jgi:hypothetical protein
MTEDAFNRKVSLLASKLNIELRKKIVKSYVCSTPLCDSETWALRNLERKYLESFGIKCWRTMEKIKWSEKVTNEDVLERIGEKRALHNTIPRRKANRFGHVLRTNTIFL